MLGGVEQHLHGGLGLVGRDLGADAHRVGDGLVEVVDPDLQVHRHLRPARFGGPDRADVVGLGLKPEVVAGVLRRRHGGAVPGLVGEQLPVEQAAEEAGQLADVPRGVQGSSCSPIRRWWATGSGSMTGLWAM